MLISQKTIEKLRSLINEETKKRSNPELITFFNNYEVVFLKEDVKKFSHTLRDFRNYIHPYQQMSIGFQPNEHTARICFQVLKTVLYQIEQKSKS